MRATSLCMDMHTAAYYCSTLLPYAVKLLSALPEEGISFYVSILSAGS